MATFVDSVNKSSDSVKDYFCSPCESKNTEASAEIFCETCLKCFCEKCIHHHDQIFVNHLKYGRGQTNKWPLTKTLEDFLMKCDVHNNKKLKMFCQDHCQLCCSDCVLLNHRQCTNLALISESVKKLSVDIKQLSNKIQAILTEINKLKRKQEDSLQSVEGSYGEKLQEIRDLRKKLNAALDELEKITLKELEESRTTLQISLKKDVDNCSRLKDELQQLSEAVRGLCDKSRKEMEFIASRKCLDKIHESETYLRENPVKVQSSLIFQANTDIELYLSQQSSLGKIVDSIQLLTLKIILDKVMNVKRKSEYNVKIPSDISQTFDIEGICSLPSGQIIVADYYNKKVKLLDKSYNVSGHCDVSNCPYDICQITSSEVAVTTFDSRDVQFISVSNGQLVEGRKLQLQHCAVGIAHHQGALYITSRTALYHYNMTGTLVKKVYEDTGGGNAVFKCAVSPDGERIFVTNYTNHKLLTLAKDGALLSTFTDSDLQEPRGLHVTPAGQVLVCAYRSNTVIQVDHEGRKKLATLASNKDGMRYPLSVCYNTNTDQIIVGLNNNNTIIVMELK